MVESRALSHPSPQYADASLLRVGSDWTPPLNTPGLQLRKVSLVSVTPDHIDVALHAAFALHAGKSALRLLLVIRISSPLFSLFILVYLFYYILLNEEEEREWREWPPTFRSCGQRSVHGGTPDLTSDKELSLLSVCLPMAFALTRDTYRTNKITLNLTTRCHHCTLRVTLDTTTNVFTSPLPTGHLPLFADHHTSSQYTSHSSPTIIHSHTTPRKPSPTPGAFGGTCER